MQPEGTNLIAGAWVAGEGEGYRAVDPTTGEELDGAFRAASPTQVRAACAAAEDGAREFAQVDRAARAAFLDAAADEVAGLDEAVLARATAESALPPARIAMEKGRTANQLRMFAALIREGSWVEARLDRAQPDRQPVPKPDLRRMLVPVGPVAVFGASNFPLAFSTAGGDTASALAAGCPVVVKAHPAHPGTGEGVAQALHRAVIATGMPASTVSFIHGPGPSVGQALVQDPALRAVAFTGSLAGGRALMDYAAARPDPIPVYAEMGSVNPVFVRADAVRARADAIADALAGSVALGVGQFCTNPGLVILPRGADADALLARLEAKLTQARGTMLTRNIASAYRAGVAAAYGKGAELLGLGDADADGGSGADVCGALGRCSAERFLEEGGLGDEVFGPFTLAVLCDDDAQMRAVAESLAGQLTATIHAEAVDGGVAALAAVLQERSGRVLWNGFPTGVEVGPAMQHGGPWPATSDARTTSVGTAAIARFARPICFQDWPAELLPAELQDGNPMGILRQVDGQWSRE